MPRRDRVEHVADVHAVDRARRALQRRLRPRAPARSPADARDPSRAKPPARPHPGARSHRTGTARAATSDLRRACPRSRASPPAASAVRARGDRGSVARAAPRAPRAVVEIVGQQALDADRHVVEPAGGVQTRPDLIAEIGGNDCRRHVDSPLPAARERPRSSGRRECVAALDARARDCCDRAARDPRPCRARPDRAGPRPARRPHAGRAPASRESAPPSDRTRRRLPRAPCSETHRPARSDSRCAVAAGSVGGAR